MFSNFNCGTEKLSFKKIFALVWLTKAGRCNIPSKLLFNASLENKSAIGNLYCV